MQSLKNILLVESFYGGSHKSWADGLIKHSKHQFELISLEDRNWKWRMQGGALELAQKANRLFKEKAALRWDVILVSSLLDLSLFKAMLKPPLRDLPIVLYLHENQFSYPLFKDGRSGAQKNPLAAHFGFINLKSAAVADRVIFNSEFHQNDFFCQSEQFLKTRPDYPALEFLDLIKEKSEVIAPGLNLSRFDCFRPDTNHASKNKVPIFLWNHRWEADKNPEEFFKGLGQLKEEGYDFKLHILGERLSYVPECFQKAKENLHDRILSFGYAESFADYAQACWESDLLWVTSRHDFFGISVLEAVFCGCYPLLPKRLAYPDHFNADEVFYGSFEEALQMLRKTLDQWAHTSINERADFSDAAIPYDWSRVIKDYDQLFESITQVASIPPRVR